MGDDDAARKALVVRFGEGGRVGNVEFFARSEDKRLTASAHARREARKAR